MITASNEAKQHTQHDRQRESPIVSSYSPAFLFHLNSHHSLPPSSSSSAALVMSFVEDQENMDECLVRRE